jgi:chromosome segregation ATPase
MTRDEFVKLADKFTAAACRFSAGDDVASGLAFVGGRTALLAAFDALQAELEIHKAGEGSALVALRNTEATLASCNRARQEEGRQRDEAWNSLHGAREASFMWERRASEATAKIKELEAQLELIRQERLEAQYIQAALEGR